MQTERATVTRRGDHRHAARSRREDSRRLLLPRRGISLSAGQAVGRRLV